jgi:hypothetical protein
MRAHIHHDYITATNVFKQVGVRIEKHHRKNRNEGTEWKKMTEEPFLEVLETICYHGDRYVCLVCVYTTARIKPCMCVCVYRATNTCIHHPYLYL